jgi:hypothetical protein
MTKFLAVLAVALAPVSAFADSCIGACGTLGADGVVTTSPQGGTYQYVTTNGGDAGAGQISGVGGTNGSTFTTSVFGANAGDLLDFYFNYVTSDGAGFSDYSWAELQTDVGGHVAWLFTARTVVAPGNTSPGFGLPANDSTLIPATSAINPGGPAWSPLGGSSGDCFDDGCGYTGWIESQYTVALAGNYKLLFGVTNWIDTIFDSGLAFDGATIAGTPITGDDVPEPSTFLLLGTGIGALALLRRRRA